MDGPEGTGARIVAWLETRIPARLRLLEERLELDANTIPDPAFVVDHETGPLGIEDWPAVYVLPQRVTGMTWIDTDTLGSEAYRVTYAVQFLAWVRDQDYPATMTLQRRYALALRECLLERKQLRSAPAYPDPDPTVAELAIKPETLRENFSPIIVDDAKRTIAGVTVDVEVTVVEVITGPTPLGTADDVVVTVHPGLE